MQSITSSVTLQAPAAGRECPYCETVPCGECRGCDCPSDCWRCQCERAEEEQDWLESAAAVACRCVHCGETLDWCSGQCQSPLAIPPGVAGVRVPAWLLA